MMNDRSLRYLVSAAAVLLLAQPLIAAEAPALYQCAFMNTRYGRIPDGWRDLINLRPSRNWAVDGKGFLRPMLKLSTGLLVYDGETADGNPAHALADARIVVEFKKTEDESVTFGIAGRVADRDNFYLARFSGAGRLELVKVMEGKEFALDFAKPVGDLQPRPTGLVTLRRYREGERWNLTLTLAGDHLSAAVFDADGREQARLEAIDGMFKRGNPGLRSTSFAAAAAFRIEAVAPYEAKLDAARLARRNAAIASVMPDYSVVRPSWQTVQLDTPREKVAADYDIIIAGAGTGGWAAAVQATRMGTRVLLLDETDWIGGQSSCAGVTTMDEGSVWGRFPVRERGLYREFHESMVAHYQTLDKDPFAAYYSYPDQLEGGYEPKAVRAVLYGFIQEARERGAVLDVSLRTRVVAVKKSGDTVTGVTVAFADAGDATRKDIACKLLVDATEYGDVIPLTGAQYRVGNVTSDKLAPTALVQDHTWTAVVREYPDGVPEHLQIKSPPPGYETGSGRRYRNYANDGFMLWGGAGKGLKGHRNWRVYFAWRGMADADSPLTGVRSGQRHTQCGFNGGNDYPVTVATIEDPSQRGRDEREGIYKTLGALYYFQHELGVNWSVAEDEGYATPYNRAKMHALDLRPDLEALAVHLPQQPYVRECRRIIGVRTLVANDLTRFEEAKHFSTSVAMGDYFMDLDHGKTAHAIEPDLDSGAAPIGGGPFQIPFEVFLPEKIDGFLPAEKNISQSRLANGATRLQPVTMLTGQAVGAIAALAVKGGVQPRLLDPRQVQRALLDAGCTLIQRWHADVPWGTPLWRATQILALHRVMDRPGAIERDNRIPLAAHAPWGANEPLKPDELRRALRRLAELHDRDFTPPDIAPGANVSAVQLATALKAISPGWSQLFDSTKLANDGQVTAGEFAIVAANLLTGASAMSSLPSPGAKPGVAPMPPAPSGNTSTKDAVPAVPFSAAERQQLDSARTAARRSPQMKAATAKFNAARKLYQADRARFPAERSKEVAVEYRKAAKEYDDATRQAVLDQHPELAPLIEKADNAAKAPRRPMNEGEAIADSDSTKNPAVRPIKDVPDLPRVLLIGDSISIGYTLQVRELLKGKANVHRIPVNGGATEVGLANVKAWLGGGRWDVIHFNFGLHDAKYASETTQRASREQYAENLRKLVAEMKATGARLIFATTTPVPRDGVLSPTRKFDSIPARNEIAVRVMKQAGVAIDDLYSVVLPVRDRVGRDNDVHFQPGGYEVLAKAVAQSIETRLPER
jgi:lysophospholipase L1-like esterase